MDTTVDLARLIVEDRWNQASTRPRRFRDEPLPGSDNCRQYYRIRNSVEELAIRLVSHCDYPTHNDKYDLEALWQDLEEHIRTTLIEWAIPIEVDRMARREKVPA